MHINFFTVTLHGHVTVGLSCAGFSLQISVMSVNLVASYVTRMIIQRNHKA